MFTREQVETIITLVSGNLDGYASQHLSKLRRHLKRFDEAKMRHARQENWQEVERQAGLLQQWEDIRRNVRIEKGGSGAQ